MSNDYHMTPSELRSVQLIQLELLCEVDRICRKCGLSYRIIAGTLLGAVRHGGFIPWDDDTDIAMMRDDYEKMFAILDAEFCRDGFFYVRGDVTRIWYKDTPAQVDVFPIDVGYSETPPAGAEYDAFIAKLNRIKESVRLDYGLIKKQLAPTPAGDIEAALAARDRDLVGKRAENGFLFYGAESLVKNRCVFSHDDVFPLKPVEFLGIKTYIPNNTEYWLYMQYGDYGTLPQGPFPKHWDIRGRLNPGSYKECQKLIAAYYPKGAKCGQ